MRAELHVRHARLDGVHQVLEHVERLALVFDKRIALAVRAKVHAVAQIVHRAQIVLPLAVDALQEHAALHVRQHARILESALGLVGLLHELVHELAGLGGLAEERLEVLGSHRHRERHAEPGEELFHAGPLGIREESLAL